MELVFQQVHVVLEMKKKHGLRPNLVLRVPQTCSGWGIIQTWDEGGWDASRRSSPLVARSTAWGTRTWRG